MGCCAHETCSPQLGRRRRPGRDRGLRDQPATANQPGESIRVPCGDPRRLRPQRTPRRAPESPSRGRGRPAPGRARTHPRRNPPTQRERRPPRQPRPRSSSRRRPHPRKQIPAMNPEKPRACRSPSRCPQDLTAGLIAAPGQARDTAEPPGTGALSPMTPARSAAHRPLRPSPRWSTSCPGYGRKLRGWPERMSQISAQIAAATSVLGDKTALDAHLRRAQAEAGRQSPRRR